MSKTIELTRGYVTVVDDADYGWLSQYKWRAVGTGKNIRAVRYRRNPNDGKQLDAKMHREIMDVLDTPSVLVDHANGNSLDNCRSNLRMATYSQNQANRPPNSDCRSGYKGVMETKTGWAAHAWLSDHSKYLGTFDAAEKAALAYDLAAIEQYGEFAWLNILRHGEELPEPPKPRTPKVNNRKLAEGQVAEVRHRLAQGESQTSISRDFPVSNVVISQIARGLSYKQ